MTKMEDKIRMVLIGDRNVYFKALFYSLLSYRDDNFTIVGLALKEREDPRSLSWFAKGKEIFQNKGFFKGAYYCLWGRWRRPPTVRELIKERDILTLETKKINSPRVKSFMEQLEPDLGIVCGGGEILKEDIFNLPKFGCLNFHAGLLPRYRGNSPIFWQLYYNDEIGYTIHKIDAGIDTGEIVVRKKIPYQIVKDLETTRVRIKREMSWDCARELAGVFAKLRQTGGIESAPQGNKGARYFRLPTVEQMAELNQRILNQLKKQ